MAQGFTLEASCSETLAQKLLVRSCAGPENFIQILSFDQKLFNFLIQTDRYTDRQIDGQVDMQMHALTAIYVPVKFLMPLFDTFHFTTFASLTPLWMENRFN